jgi:hypothetical protein
MDYAPSAAVDPLQLIIAAGVADGGGAMESGEAVVRR